MYLKNATGFDEVITFGIDPLVALLEYFEDEHLDIDNNPGSKEAIYWNLIKALALSTQHASKKIHAQKALKTLHRR